METRAKKRKIQQENSILDPLQKLCFDVHGLIFQHFDNQTVLSLSQTSPEWNSVVSSSPICMSKFKLRLKHSQPVPRILLQNQRKYSCLDIAFGSQETPENIKKKIQILTKHSTILRVLNLTISINNVEVPQLALPKLESFTYASRTSSVVFTNAKNLKTLGYYLFNAQISSEVVEWIQKQEKLKELRLFSRGNFFDSNAIPPKGLKAFHFSSNEKLSERDWSKINKFLEPIRETLTTLSLDECAVENLKFILASLPNLKKFRCDRFVGEGYHYLEFEPNKNIIEFKTSVFWYYNWHHDLLQALVNLEVLNVDKIFNLEWIPRNMMKLKKLLVRQDFVKSFVSHYESMKMNEEKINRNIEITTEY
jgi:hypothetical protein